MVIIEVTLAKFRFQNLCLSKVIEGKPWGVDLIPPGIRRVNMMHTIKEKKSINPDQFGGGALWPPTVFP